MSNTPRVIPVGWMPPAKINRIIVHWTAGTYRPTDDDRSHYHLLIDGDGRLVKGIPSIAGNSASNATGKRASHTLNANTGAIGVSLACMGLAVEQPWNPGKWPMKRIQWEALMPVLADLCDHYGIKVTNKTLLTHAEVSANLKIPQKGKWDIARLAFDPDVGGARPCGDLMRSMVKAELAGVKPVAFAELGSDDGGDGGEPDDPVGLEEQAVPHGQHSPDFAAVQRRLIARGYVNAGTPNGDWGGWTAGAIAAFKNDRHLAGEPVIDDELLAELSKAEAEGWMRPISEARANATPEEVRARVPAAKASWRSKLAAFWAAVSAGVTGVVVKAAESFQTVWDALETPRAVLTSIPLSIWLAGICGVALFIALQSKGAEDDTVDAVRTGKLP